MAGVCFLYRTVQMFVHLLSQHIFTQHLWLPSTSIMVKGLDLDLPKVTQPGAAESGLSPGLLDFRAPAHNHCTILPLEKLQADEESPGKRRMKRSGNTISQKAHKWSGGFAE